VSRWRRETEPEMLAFAEGLAADAARYQAAFGYTA
jgi:hypothetical protein